MRHALSTAIGCLLTLLVQSSSSRALEPAKFLPPDTVFVALVRPKPVMTSALVKSQGWDELLKAMVATNGPAQEFLENAGLNPFTQIDSVLVASTVFPLLVNPSPEEASSFKPSMLVAIRGNFQSKKLVKALETMGKENGAPVKRVRVDDLTLWELPVPGVPVYVAIHNQQKAVFLATRKDDAVRCIRGGFEGLKSRELTEALTNLDGKEAIYLAGTISKKMRENTPLDPAFQPVADHMDAWSLGAMVTDSIHLGLNLVPREGKSPATLRDSMEKKLLPDLKDKITKAREAAANQPDKVDIGDRILKAYLDLLQGTRFATDGRTIRLKCTLTEALLDSLQGKEGKKP